MSQTIASQGAFPQSGRQINEYLEICHCEQEFGRVTDPLLYYSIHMHTD